MNRLCPLNIILSAHSDYLDELTAETISYCETGTSQERIDDVPEPLCSQYERPEKTFAIQQHRSRFNL